MSIQNRFRYGRIIKIVCIVVACLVLFVATGDFIGYAMFNYQEAHRLDRVYEEKMAIDYVGRQYLDGERNYGAPEEIIRLDFKDFNGVRYMSVWTENCCYYGPADQYSYSKIEIRE